MNVKVDPSTLNLVFKLNDKDIEDANEIYKTMQTVGWKRLCDYWSVAREHLIDLGKSSSMKESDKTFANERWATLKGFDEFSVLPQRIVDRAQSYLDSERNKKKEEENETFE